MENKYLIDRHKIMFHPEELALWLKSQDTWANARRLYPIYAEISASGVCNHRCKFCAYDYLGYKSGFADVYNLKRAIRDMAKGGVKSINFSGEGEPLLHPKIKEIIKYAKALGMDIALTTNGTLIREELIKEILPALTWLKASIDAGTPETHMKIHRSQIRDFNVIMNNLIRAAEIRKALKSECALGGQMLLLPDNYQEAVILAKKLKEIGLDYLIVKPYAQNEKSVNREYKDISYGKYFYLRNQLEKLNNSAFQVIFREKTMKKSGAARPYKICHAVPFFWVHLTASGDVYGCGNFLGDKRFRLGNYNKKSFKEIWEGEGRRRHWQFMRTEFNASRCRKNCRMDEINIYLEGLKNPPRHANFI